VGRSGHIVRLIYLSNYQHTSSHGSSGGGGGVGTWLAGLFPCLLQSPSGTLVLREKPFAAMPFTATYNSLSGVFIHCGGASFDEYICQPNVHFLLFENRCDEDACMMWRQDNHSTGFLF
jgi:hypothetical protein